MSTAKQIAANKANAQHSTGPQSQAAKDAVRHNATKHGLTSQRLIIPGEDPAAFESLAADLAQSYHPANLHEEILVNQIAENLWRLLRARGIETATFKICMPSLKPAPIIPGAIRLRTPANGSEAAARAFEDNAHAFDNLRRYEAAIERAYYRAIDHLMKLQKDRRATEPKQTANPVIGVVSQTPAAPKTFSATESAAILPDSKTQVPVQHLVPSH